MCSPTESPQGSGDTKTKEENEKTSSADESSTTDERFRRKAEREQKKEMEERALAEAKEVVERIRRAEDANWRAQEEWNESCRRIRVEKERSEREPQRQSWKAACVLYFGDQVGVRPFPQPPSIACQKTHCVRGENLGVCHHVIEVLLSQDAEHLKNERLRWHPDKFSGKSEVDAKKAQEMFQLIQHLIDSRSMMLS